MRRSGRGRAHLLSAALLTGSLLTGSLLTAPGAAADVDKTGARALTTRTAAVVPGQSAWLSVVWTADRTAANWSTTVTAPPGVAVTYPTTRGGTDTSLYGSDVLVGSTRDFTAFELSVPYTQTAPFQVTLRSTYTDTCGDNGQCKDQGAGNDDRVRDRSTTATVTVPVQAATGPAFTQTTSSITVAAGSNTFQDIAFTGGQADLGDFTVRAGALPAGLRIGYPGDAAASRPSGGSSLTGGRSDHVAIRFDATAVRPGSYAVPLVLTYTAAAPVTATGTVTLVVR